MENNLSDEEIVIRIRKGEEDYFYPLVERYEKKLRTYINRLINNPDAAEDLLQETFIRVYRNIYSFDTKRKFSSWVYRISHNLSVDWLRNKKTAISLDQNEFLANKLAAEIDIVRTAYNNELKKNLDNALNKLPQKYKIPLILKYMENKSYEEISDILRKPKNTVGTDIKRAKELLKKDLQKTYGERY